MLQPLHLMHWIESNRHLLKPPVCNRMIWEDREFFIMVLGGPNHRMDYHVNTGEEFFYQLEGDITLRILHEGKPKDIPIRAGEIYLLPPLVPHSPQRPVGSIGLVIERKRFTHENDGFIWYCETCHHKLYEEFFHLTNIVTQLPPLFERFYSNLDLTTCKACGSVAKKKKSDS